MSDLVWVAAISSAAALGGAAIAGLITYGGVKRQIDSQAAQVKIQLLVDARRAPLGELQACVSRSFGALSNFVSAIINMKALQDLGVPEGDPNAYINYVERFEGTRQSIVDEAQELESQRSRIGDAELMQLVSQIETDINRHFSSFSTVTDNDALVSTAVQVRTDLIDLRTSLIAFNRRVEQLLSGAEE